MKTLLVAMSRPDTVYGTHPVRYAVVDGRTVLEQGQGAADEVQRLSGHSLRLSLDSPANLTERLRLRALSRRFVPVLVQRHLSDTGAYTERFRARSRIRSLRHGEAEVDVQAMLEEDAELAQELLPAHDRPLTHLVTPESAIAALVGAASRDPVLVHWHNAGALRSLGVREGHVTWQRVQPLGHDGMAGGSNAWRSLLQSAASMAPSEFTGPNSQTVWLGEGPWAWDEEWGTAGSRELLDKIAALFKGVEPKVVFQNPDLYGLAHTAFSDSLVVNGQRQRVIAWRWAPAVASVAAAAGIALVGMGLWWHAQATRTMAELELTRAALNGQAQTLRTQLPPTEAVIALRSAAWRETALGANLRTDRFLDELLSQMPPGVQVTSLHIERNGSASERVRLVDGQPVVVAQNGKNTQRRALAKRPPNPDDPVLQRAALESGSATSGRRMPVAGEPSFQVDLDILLSGGYAAAKLKAEQLAERLTLLGRLSNTNLTFEDSAPSAPGARLRTRLTIAAGAF